MAFPDDVFQADKAEYKNTAECCKFLRYQMVSDQSRTVSPLLTRDEISPKMVTMASAG